jgi:hypothetical protein
MHRTVFALHACKDSRQVGTKLSVHARARHATRLAFHARSDDGKPETRPPLLVTASVDRIALARRLALDADLTMAGSVIWTGRSALDIRMQLRQVCMHPPSPSI